MIERTFSIGDQHCFADLSGDRNPIHVDPIAARRLIAGEPVVHGMHVLLWALDALAAAETLPVPSHMNVAFVRFLPVGERAGICVTRRGADRLDVEVIAGNAARCTIRLCFSGPVSPGASVPCLAADAPFFATSAAADMPVEAMPDLAGRVPPAAPLEALATAFPSAARWLGAERLAALTACTRLVGMTCPGLHSLFSGLVVALHTPAPDDNGTIAFAVKAVRHGLVTMDVAGGGVVGQLTAVVRAAPHRQPGMADLAGHVPPGTFAGQRALVAGGSRGLGELTAKLLAAGGAAVFVTWSTGEADAAAVADDIRAGGGRCETLRYRIGESLNLSALPGQAPTHGYYFAAPVISRPSSRFFDADRLGELENFFVNGFWRFAMSLRERDPAVRLFYPSTVYIGDRPRGLAEYAMAKAAGEILCGEMNAQLAPLTVISARLPRLPTDQTASVFETAAHDPVAVLLPLIQEVQRRGG